MAGDWIKWTKGLAKRPEVLHMAHVLGRSRHEVAGLLCEFWEWTDDNVVPSDSSATCPGFVRIVSASCPLVDSLAGVDGFAKAMSAVGWLIIRDDTIEFPKFGRHNGKSAKRRALDAERRRSGRECPQGVHNLSASEADKMKTRGEESRVDINTEDSPEPSSTASEPTAAGSSLEENKTSGAKNPTEPSILTFPVTGDPKAPTWALTQKHIDDLSLAYPNLDILAECRKALLWVNANSAKRKTARGMLKFLVSWMSRANDSGKAATKTVSNGSGYDRIIRRPEGPKLGQETTIVEEGVPG